MPSQEENIYENNLVSLPSICDNKKTNPQAINGFHKVGCRKYAPLLGGETISGVIGAGEKVCANFRRILKGADALQTE